MNGSLLRITITTRTLLRQNRLLIAVLLAWPLILSCILMASASGGISSEDVAAVLEQELFYGLVLVGLGASVALGTEQKAHRTQQILGRAVGRAEYLLALGASAYLPFVGYVATWLLSAGIFAKLLHLHTPQLLPVILAELLLGLILCAAGLIFSVLLQQFLAALATGLMLAVLAGAGASGLGSVARLFRVLVGQLGSSQISAGVISQSLLLIAGMLTVAMLLFRHKDLHLH